METIASVQKVTEIRPAARSENRVNVFVDGGYAFSLDLAQVVELKVKVGMTVSPEQLEEFRRASEYGKLYQRALEWVLIRPRSEQEVREYFRRRMEKRRVENLARAKNRAYVEELKREGKKEALKRARERRLPVAELAEIDGELVELVIKRLEERGYLDERKFAEYYVENRFVKKGVSEKRLRLELAKKGVAPEIVEAVLMEAGRDERTEILKVIRRKRGKYDEQKLLAYLVGQGFNYELVKELIADAGREDF